MTKLLLNIQENTLSNSSLYTPQILIKSKCKAYSYQCLSFLIVQHYLNNLKSPYDKQYHSFMYSSFPILAVYISIQTRPVTQINCFDYIFYFIDIILLVCNVIGLIVFVQYLSLYNLNSLVLVCYFCLFTLKHYYFVVISPCVNINNNIMIIIYINNLLLLVI